MGWIKRKVRPVDKVEPFSEWRIVTTWANGVVNELVGHCWEGSDPAESLRYAEAIASGLRSAGYDAQVEIVRKRVETR